MAADVVWTVAGKEHRFTAAAIEAEVRSASALEDPLLVEALVRAAEPRTAVLARLGQVVDQGGPNPATLIAAMGLLRLGTAAEGARLRTLARRIVGPPSARVKAAAFLAEDRLEELAGLFPEDALLARHSAEPYSHLRRLPSAAPRLFSAWLDQLQQAASSTGSSAYRLFVGEVAEAAFRALQLGANKETLLDGRAATLVDVMAAELPGTTDFLSARGMAWLMGALAPEDDAVRAGIERARGRFHDEAFAADCDAMLRGEKWPP